MKKWVSQLEDSKLSIALFIVLIIATLIMNPSQFAPGAIATTFGLVAPLLLASCSVSVVFLVGRGGIDLSVGPLMGLINVIIVKYVILDAGITSPLVVVLLALILGGLGGALNGVLAIYLRIQPIVATLATYLVFSGLAMWLLPAPIGPVPGWLTALSQWASPLPVLAVAALWLGLRRFPIHAQMLQVGMDDRAAFAAGVPVDRIRLLAYVLSGLIAAVAALSLTALLGSADAQIGPNYTLLAVASAALGGVSLAGGRGRLIGAALGAIDIFLIQNLITHFNLSTFVLQITYGLVLILAVCLNSPILRERLTPFTRKVAPE